MIKVLVMIVTTSIQRTKSNLPGLLDRHPGLVWLLCLPPSDGLFCPQTQTEDGQIRRRDHAVDSSVDPGLISQRGYFNSDNYEFGNTTPLKLLEILSGFETKTTICISPAAFETL